MDELFKLTARAMVDLLGRAEISPLEAIDAALARIEATDGALNALPTLCAERAREAARRMAPNDAASMAPGWLAGLPIAVKDLNDVSGVRTTYGSPIFADNLPERSDVMVETLERRGAVVLAKSNTPEFGAGANTFNEVFGATLNPWNTAKTCGGSSGGSAVALASGQVWLATGSDLGGSLRTPASFCSVVGLRPGPGRVARGPVSDPFDTLSVDGPMGRTVGDVALMLDAMAGTSVEDPLALPAPAEPFVKAVDAPVPPARVAFSRDLGFVPVEAEVADICEAAAGRFVELGAAVEEACPDFSDAMDIFQVLRAAKFALAREPLLRNHRDSLKPEMVWNIEKGLALAPGEIFRAMSARAGLVRRVAAFFGPHDLLLCPAAPVPPFDVGHRYVEQIGDHRFENYIDWIAITYAITLTSCPALVIPCGFTTDGLPVGLQMVGRPRGEAALLSAAALAEDALALGDAVPIDPRPPSQARS